MSDHDLKEIVRDAYNRLLRPSLENEVLGIARERAETDAIRVFRENAENLLLLAPAGQISVIGVDPGLRTGCKLAVVDQTGNLVEHATVFPTPPQNDIEGAEKVLVELINKHNVRAVAIGNGTGSREVSAFIRDALRRLNRDDLFSVLEILKAISSRRRAHDVLFVFVEQIARVIETNRCSIVQVWGGERKGRVQASHEDETVSDLVIDLEKYPEILHAMETRQKVVINDVARHRLTRQYARQLSEAGIRVLMVIPIVLFDPNVGSLFLRVTRRRGSFALREIGFCEIVAEAAGNALERAQLFERIQRANERLERLAVTDALTGLHNRRHFHQRLQEEYQRSKRYALPLACVMFDIDDFKKINDNYGHLAGDHTLKSMALLLKKTFRSSDIISRFGGDEFAVFAITESCSFKKYIKERIFKSWYVVEEYY